MTKAANSPQTTLAHPPDGKLRFKLADKAVHDFTIQHQHIRIF